jgi:hypothetical protein
MIERVVPQISFSKCKKHCAKGFKFKKKDIGIDDILKKFKVWAFTMSDESDHLKYKAKTV